MESGFIYAIGAAVLWGLIYAIDQKILSSVAPMTMTFVSAVMAAVIVLPFLFLNEGLT